MILLQNILKDVIHLFYPHICIGCGSDILSEKNLLCIKCTEELPHTNFAQLENNSIEKIFFGRINLKAAHSEFYFSKGQLIQHLIHLLKYKNNKEVGYFLGEIMGNSLLISTRFSNIDCLIPLPLYADKEFKRGYNQAEVICQGIKTSTNIPLISNKVIRQRSTETQTRKHRAERWQNVEGSFIIKNPDKLEGKSILLVDDVITTGATLEACGQEILKIPGTSLSFASLAFASK